MLFFFSISWCSFLWIIAFPLILIVVIIRCWCNSRRRLCSSICYSSLISTFHHTWITHESPTKKDKYCCRHDSTFLYVSSTILSEDVSYHCSRWLEEEAKRHQLAKRTSLDQQTCETNSSSRQERMSNHINKEKINNDFFPLTSSDPFLFGVYLCCFCTKEAYHEVRNSNKNITMNNNNIQCLILKEGTSSEDSKAITAF